MNNQKNNIGTYVPRMAKGRFGFKSAIRRFLHREVSMRTMSVVVALGLVGFFFAGYAVPRETAKAEQGMDTLAVKVQQLKGELLTRLQGCESGGSKDGDALIIFDKNKVASIGKFQWQLKSVVHYVKELRGEKINTSQALLIANDYEEARNLAGEVIFGTKNGLNNWQNCDIKLGLSRELAIINKIQN